MKLMAFTNPGAFTVAEASWDHPALFCWRDAIVAWDRDCPELTPTGIYIWNGDQRPNLWCGIETVEVLYGRKSNVVNWCRRHVRWEIVHGHRDCHIDEKRAYQLGVGHDAYCRKMAPLWRKLGNIEGY